MRNSIENSNKCVCEKIEERFNKLKKLKEMGASISGTDVYEDIDDYGASYTSLGMVKTENEWIISASGDDHCEATIKYCPFCGKELK